MLWRRIPYANMVSFQVAYDQIFFHNTSRANLFTFPHVTFFARPRVLQTFLSLAMDCFAYIALVHRRCTRFVVHRESDRRQYVRDQSLSASSNLLVTQVIKRETCTPHAHSGTAPALACSITAGACCVGMRTSVWGRGGPASVFASGSSSSLGFGSFAALSQMAN
jgi:hypothetical protein